MNLKTKRAHKLILSAAGTDEISKASNWTQGIYPQEFKTNFPASFENFDDCLALLTPRSGTNCNNHILRIGWLASIEINQPHGEGFGTWYLYGNCRIEYGNGESKSAGTISPYGGYKGGVVVFSSDF